MRSMATQTDVNNHKNQRHSLHYPLGSPGSYADEKVRVFLYQKTKQLVIVIYVCVHIPNIFH